MFLIKLLKLSGDCDIIYTAKICFPHSLISAHEKCCAPWYMHGLFREHGCSSGESKCSLLSQWEEIINAVERDYLCIYLLIYIYTCTCNYVNIYINGLIKHKLKFSLALDIAADNPTTDTVPGSEQWAEGSNKTDRNQSTDASAPTHTQLCFTWRQNSCLQYIPPISGSGKEVRVYHFNEFKS